MDPSLDPNSDYVFDDVPVQASAGIATSQRATPDELVEMASKIWGEVRASGVAADDDPGNEALLKRLQEAHKDFGQSFPLVLRWMVQLRLFSPRALRKYLLKHASARLDTREEFLRLQAEYLVILHKEAHPHADESRVKRYRDGVVEALLREDREFMEITRQVEEDMAKTAAAVSAERRQKIYSALLAEKVRRERERADPQAPTVGEPREGPQPAGSVTLAP